MGVLKKHVHGEKSLNRGKSRGLQKRWFQGNMGGKVEDIRRLTQGELLWGGTA